MDNQYILFSKKGNSAKIKYDDTLELDVNSFDLELYVSGKAYLLFDIKKQASKNISNPSKIEFIGTTSDGFSFSLDITKDFNENPFHFEIFDSVSKKIQILRPLHIKKESDTKNKKLKQYFTNYIFDYNSQNTKGFELAISKKKFVFRNVSNYKEIKEIINKTNLTKITGFIENNITEDLDLIKEITKNCLELISYSQRQFVQVVYDEFLVGNEVIEYIIYPQVLRPARSGFTVVESDLVYSQEQSIIKFIEETYDNYINWKTKIKIDYSLVHYLLAFIPKQGEIEFILVFTAIESLIRHYEDHYLESKKYDLVKIKQDQFEKKIKSKLPLSDSDIKILCDPNNKFFYQNLSFDESLNIIYKGKVTSEYKDESFGLNLKRNEFECQAPNIRNNLIHKGEFKNYDDLNMISINSKNIVFMFDKIFLSLLKYKGLFRDYRDIEKWIKLENINSKKKESEQ